MRKKKIAAILVAGGQGLRMGGKVPKQFQLLREKPLYHYALGVFLQVPAITRIVMVVPEDYAGQLAEEWPGVCFVPGGQTRQESVYCGLRAVVPDTDIVMIHDVARPFVTEREILEMIQCCETEESCTYAVPAKDTLKHSTDSKYADGNLERSQVWQIQTPQGFWYTTILKAHERALAEGFEGTDDTALAEYAGARTRILRGSYRNIKITTEEDMWFGRALIGHENS